MALFDLIQKVFSPGGIGAQAAQADQAGTAMGLPHLKGGFSDYGPWGAGGGKLGAGAFPEPPSVTGPLQPSGPQVGPAQPAKFNALLDPNRGGFLSTIGALTGAPTRAEWERQQAGQGATAAYQGLAERMTRMSPQAAILDYVKTPDGQQWFMHSADPIGDIKAIVGQLVPPKANVNTVGKQLVDDNGNVIYTGPEDPYNMSPGQMHVTPGANGAQVTTAPLSPTELQQKYDEYVKDQTDHGLPVLPRDQWQTTHERNVAAQSSAVTRSGKVIAPDWVKKQVELTEGVAAAQNTAELLTQFENILDSNDTGAMQAITQPMNSLLVSMGLASEERVKKVGAMGVLEGLGNQLALLARQGGFTASDKIGLTGNTSDRDLTFLIKSVPNIWNTTLANKGLVIILRAQARRKADIDDLKAAYISGDAPGQTTDGGNLNGFQDYLETQLKPGGKLDGNFLTDEEKAILLDLNSKAAGAPPLSTGAAGEAGKTSRAGPAPKDFEPDDPDRQKLWEFYHEEKLKQRMK